MLTGYSNKQGSTVHLSTLYTHPVSATVVTSQTIPVARCRTAGRRTNGRAVAMGTHGHVATQPFRRALGGGVGAMLASAQALQ